MPADGFQGQAPNAPVRVTFSEALPDLTALDLWVADGAGPLPGTLTTADNGTTWVWSSVRPLPLGATLEVRMDAATSAPSGARPDRELLSTFTVVEPTPTVYELDATADPDVQAWSWSVAAPVVLNGGRVLSAVGAGVVAMLPAPGSPIAAARDDLGGWVAAVEANQRVLALRALANGPIAVTDLGPTDGALGVASLAVNRRGDAMLYTYRPGFATPTEALFQFEARANAWQPVAPTPTTLVTARQLDIDGVGNAWVGFVDDGSGRLMIQRVDAATGASENIAISDRLPGRYWVAAADSGDHQVIWDEPVPASGDWVRHLRVSRQGVLQPTVEFGRGPRLEVRAFASPPTGSAILVFEGPNGWSMERHELDGSPIQQALVAAEAPERFELCAATRGEAWLVFVGTIDGQRGIYGVRSAIGRAIAAPRLLVASDNPIEGLSPDIDDGGRLVAAFTERINGTLRLRCVVAQ